MIKALAITGPTASGKTALSIRVAMELGCEILSCDSMQIYEGLAIGTAKATDEERRLVPHHLLDLVSPSEKFSAADYREIALARAEEIAARGKIPLFVGGTGLYLDSLMRCESSEVPKSDVEYRDKILENIKTDEDKIALYERLAAVDPISAAKAHPNNLRRVIRALEIYEKTGKPKSYFDELSKTAAPPIDITILTIDFQNRDLLYKRIDERVEIMYKEGLANEVLSLHERGLLIPDTTAAQAIGYKEIVDAVTAGKTPESAMDEIKQASRNYAKRQLTWCRHYEGAKTIFADDECGLKDADAFVLEGLNVLKEAYANKS